MESLLFIGLLVILAFLAAVGHVAVWVAAFNRVHATSWSCRVIGLFEKIIAVIVISGITVFAWRLKEFQQIEVFGDVFLLPYLTLCLAVAIFIVPFWVLRQRKRLQPPAVVESNHTRVMSMLGDRKQRPIHGLWVNLLERAPGNQILQLHIQEKTLLVKGLPGELDGLTITHISDLHYTGQLTQAYYERLVEHANELQGDLVAITGDIVEKAKCIDWLPDTLGRLTSRYGVYFVLGNHDKRLNEDAPRLRQCLQDLGMIDLGGQWRLETIHGRQVMLAGNELPWFPISDLPPPLEKTADSENGAEDSQDRSSPFRILLSHSPDQIRWARARGFNLMLAGHTHGGQVRFPFIGPLVAPSHFGVRYASGVFYESPTLMHVTRGIAGLQPLRINCPPELNKLILRRSE